MVQEVSRRGAPVFLVVSLIVALLVAPAGFPAGAAIAQEQAEESFIEELERVRLEMERQRWEKAYDRLRNALNAHAGRQYVGARRVRIREDMRRIVFWRDRELPSPADLVEGELRAYDEVDGDIEIAYSGEALRRDFGWTNRNRRLAFPAYMGGPYSLKIQGSAYPKDGIWVIVDNGRDRYSRLDFGFLKGDDRERHPSGTMLAYDVANEPVELLDQSKRRPLRAGEPFELLVTVSDAYIAADVAGDRYMRGLRQRGGFGGFVVYGIPEWVLYDIEVKLKGTVDTGWVGRLLDAEIRRARQAFHEEYEEGNHLPEWLLADAAPSDGLAKSVVPHKAAFQPNRRGLPGEALNAREQGIHQRATQRLEVFLARRDADGAFAYVDALQDTGVLPDAVCAWLRYRVSEDLGLPNLAIEHLEQVRKHDPGFVRARIRRAELLGIAARGDEAEAAWQGLLADLPYDPKVIWGITDFYLAENRLDEAIAWANECALDPRARDEIEPVQRLLYKAKWGPPWRRIYEHESEHYVVRSNVGQEVCGEAARILESAYVSYANHLARTPGLGGRRFRVYVFSSAEGYRDYAEETLGGRMEHSSGLYSARLKQLLVVNLSNRGDSLRALLHEGFHQYLDEVMRNPPVWFNEGMASYFEMCEVVEGRWMEGQVRGRYLVSLRERPPMPLIEFVEVTPERFYGQDMLWHYAQGWALIHFLRNSTREHEDLFEAIFEELREQPSQRVALDAALEGVDLAELDRAFRAHLAEL